jgi:CubicO group peptidase (beta-lactamase class C family)
LASLYTAGPDGALVRNRSLGDRTLRPPELLAGGAGLVSTAGDYHRFTRMLLQGGELDGVRLLGPRTVAYMTRNHLPDGADLETIGRPNFAESSFRGVGFGLGFSTVADAAAGKVLTSEGEYAWGGMASTAFYVDPATGVIALFFTQFMPSSAFPIRSRLRTLVNQALVD